MFDIAIIGGGVVGCAVAYRLSRYSLKVAVLEKENDVALGQTRANSAIIHAGFDPEPGTLMARLNVEGCRQAPELCKRLGVHYKNNGSMVLAFSQEEEKTVKRLFERGKQNGVPGLRLLSGDEVRKKEKNVSENVVAALYAPSAGIINPWEYALAFAEVAALNGTEFIFDFAVNKIENKNGVWKISSGGKSVEAKYVVNAAGVHSGDIHNMVAAPSFTITPSKGQYYIMDKSEGTLAGATLFQCPSSVGKGVLVSPTVHGNLIVGPDATQTSEPDRVNTTGDRLEFVRATAAKSVPGINYRNAIRTFAGVRANSDKEDFIISFAAPKFLDLAGIKSPGLSAAPAIGSEAVKLLQNDGLEMSEKSSFVDSRERIVFKELPDNEKAELVRKNPLYGRIICRCETITEGEIVQALHSPIPARTIDGVKRRCNAGMGRCQGGFCSPRVLDIICRETGCAPTDVEKDKAGSKILLCASKEE